MKIKNLLLKTAMLASSLAGISQTNLVQNGDFSQNSCTSFANGCVTNWVRHQNTPDLFGQNTDPHAWMWSYNETGEAIRTQVSFKEGQCYTISFRVKTDDYGHSDSTRPNPYHTDYIKENGTINLRAVNLSGSTITSQEVIYTNTIGGAYFENWQTITTTFTPSSSFTTLLINPYCDNPSGGGQAEMAIDDVVITDGNVGVNFDFVDTSGGITTDFCEGDIVTLDGTASLGETKYKVQIDRKPINGGTYQYVSTINWTNGNLGTLNLSALLAPQGIIFEEGFEYKATVTLSNDCLCNEGKSLSKSFKVIEKKQDLYIKDTPNDIGVEPNTQSSYYWGSKDIWVTTDPSGLVHQNPNYYSGQQTYIRVRVTNRGNKASTGTEKLHTYWAKASTGLGWPNFWNGQINVNCPSNAVAGNELASAPLTIPVLQPGQTTIVTFPWNTIPNPADYSCFGGDQWHFCLLARINDPVNDPMTFTEGSSTITNTKNNNNIAWKNISVINKKTGPKVTVAVANPFEERGSFTLVSELQNLETGELLQEYAEAFCCHMICQDCPIFYATAEGEVLQKEVVVGNEPHQLIGRVDFEPFEISTVHLDFTQLLEELDPTKEYEYRLIQKDAKTGEVVGGETFLLEKTETIKDDVLLREESIIKTTESNDLTKNSISVYPNPLKTGESFKVSSLEKIKAINFIDFKGDTIDISIIATEGGYTITPLKTVNSGVYFVNLTKASGEIEIIKLAIQ